MAEQLADLAGTGERTNLSRSGGRPVGSRSFAKPGETPAKPSDGSLWASRPEEKPPESGLQLDVGLLLCALESSGDAVEIAQPDGHVVYVNGAWCTLFDFEPGGSFGPWWETLSGERAPIDELFATWGQCLSAGHASGAFVLESQAGPPLRLSFSRFLYGFPGSGAKAVVTIYRAAEAGPQRHRRQRPSRRQAEHDLRNLLTMVSTNVEVLNWLVTEPDIRSRLASVRTAARQGVAVLGALCGDAD